MIRLGEDIGFDIMDSDDYKGVFDECGKRPHSESRTSRITHHDFIINYLGAKCVWCGDNRLHHLQIDHIYPKSKGGSDIEGNLQILCAKCNLQKSNKFESQISKFKMVMK